MTDRHASAPLLETLLQAVSGVSELRGRITDEQARPPEARHCPVATVRAANEAITTRTHDGASFRGLSAEVVLRGRSQEERDRLRLEVERAVAQADFGGKTVLYDGAHFGEVDTGSGVVYGVALTYSLPYGTQDADPKA